MIGSKDYLKSTKRLARITRKCCRAFIWIAAIGTVIMLAATIFVSVYPIDQLKLKDGGSITLGDSSFPLPLVEIHPYTDSSGRLNFSFNGGMLVPSESMSSVEVLRSYLWSFFARMATGAAIFILSAVFLTGLLRSVETGDPFAMENAARLRNIGITLIAGAVFSPAINSLTVILATHTNLLDVKSNSMIDFTLLLCGLLVIILSGIFAYGARLQREHDQTV